MSAVPSTDPALALAIAFVNTYDLLESPPDRLTPTNAATIARRHGFAGLAEQLARAGDPTLDRLRTLRERLYQVFAAREPAAQVDALNEALDSASVRPRVGLDESGAVRLRAVRRDGGADPVGELAALVTDAMAYAMSVGGPGRFGTCAADPCRCVYVDRTRAGRQRFCCELCNDRMAAAAYRSRRAASPRDAPASGYPSRRARARTSEASAAISTSGTGGDAASASSASTRT
jgi:predicted RNA-binding Zn ribbon-like protein